MLVSGNGNSQHGAVIGEKRQSMWVWTRVVAVLVSLGLLVVIARRLDLPALLQALQDANPLGLLGAFLIFGCGLSFSAWRWHLMLRLGGNVVHPGASLRGVVIGHCFHTFLFGAAGGDVVKSGIYARWYRLKMSEVLAAAPLDRLMALVGAILFGGSMLVIGISQGALDILGGRQLWFPILWICTVIAGVILFGVLICRWRGTRIEALDRFRRSLQKGGAALFADRFVLLKSAMAAFSLHACLSFTMVACLASVTEVSISWWSILWLFPLISMISGLPVGFGGAGLREGAALVLLGFFQVPGEDAVAASLFTLAVNFAWCFVGLGLWWWGERRLVRSDDETLPETISVVIPTLNEAGSLAETVRTVQRIDAVEEVILADGGSTDATCELGESLGCRIVRAAPGRGTQMRAAAQVAHGDVVWLVHADTVLPEGAGRALLATFRDRRVVGGGFWKDFDRASIWMWGSRFRCLPRILFAKRLMGDQAMFVKRSVLESVGGVPDVPLMEEFELCRALRPEGVLALADATVITSARKFHRRGVLRTYWLMWRVTLRYYWGTPVSELAEMYKK